MIMGRVTMIQLAQYFKTDSLPVLYFSWVLPTTSTNTEYHQTHLIFKCVRLLQLKLIWYVLRDV